MTTSVRAELPEELVEQARKFVEAGWAASFDQLMADALQRYLESHSADCKHSPKGWRSNASHPEKPGKT